MKQIGSSETSSRGSSSTGERPRFSSGGNSGYNNNDDESMNLIYESSSGNNLKMNLSQETAMNTINKTMMVRIDNDKSADESGSGNAKVKAQVKAWLIC